MLLDGAAAIVYRDKKPSTAPVRFINQHSIQMLYMPRAPMGEKGGRAVVGKSRQTMIDLMQRVIE